MKTIIEPSREIPVLYETDVCIIGGGIAGVFAAIRAANAGVHVMLVEQGNCFGGVATQSMVNNWHSIWDEDFEQQIIGGLITEVIDRLQKRNAILIQEKDLNSFQFNSDELKIELDQMLSAAGVKLLLHTRFSSPCLENGVLKAVVIENKSGRSAICSRIFIDASGDADLAHSLGLTYPVKMHLQPPTLLAKMYWEKTTEGLHIQELLSAHGEEFGLHKDSGFHIKFPVLENVSVHAETHVFGVNGVDAQSLTNAELEGRRHIRAIMDLLRKYGPKENTITLLGIASHIGIRETRHIKGRYRLTEAGFLLGERHHDAIANGSYPVDIHYPDRPGVVLKFLNGKQVIKDYHGEHITRWLDEGKDYAKFWQIPYRALLTEGCDNLLCCGRILDADEGAYGAYRVMVYAGQTGEAAGEAAAMSIKDGLPPHELNTEALRSRLADGGSIIF